MIKLRNYFIEILQNFAGKLFQKLWEVVFLSVVTH